MPSEWSTKTFAELIEMGTLEIGDGYRAKNNELGGDGLIFLRAGHVRDTHIDFAGVDRFNFLGDLKFAHKVARTGDVVVTTKGNSTGRVAFVTGDMPKFVYSPHLSYWRSKANDTLAQGFLRAWSRADEFKTQLDSLSRSTDMAPYLSLSDQRRLRISLPPITEQKAIASLADSLGQRIELLRQTNATLEAIAQAQVVVHRFRPRAGQGGRPRTRGHTARDSGAVPERVREIGTRGDSEGVAGRNLQRNRCPY